MKWRRPSADRLVIVAAFLALAACAPREQLDGASVVWSSADGQERVVVMGPCTKTQVWDDYVHAWYTTFTQCSAPSFAP